MPYNAGLSTGFQPRPFKHGSSSTAVKARADALHKADPANTRPIPVDLVTASASGLDPDISIAAAHYQVPRIARERNRSEVEIQSLVEQHTEGSQFGIFGEPRVNVLHLNLALDNPGAAPITPVTQAGINPSPPVETGMRLMEWLSLLLFIGIFVVTVVPLGRFMMRVFKGEPTLLSPVIEPLESLLLDRLGVDRYEEMDWKTFGAAMMVFNVLGIIVVFLLLSVQQYLPLNPARVGPAPWDLSLNTAVSFATNTNWQAYAGETAVSYLTQMIGLCVQNFLSAATGMAVLIALIYGLSRRSTEEIGNFWVLLVRSVMILLPLSAIIALLLVSQGAVQTFHGPVTVPPP